MDQMTILPDEQMPITDEVKKKPRVNCLQEMVIELMNEKGLRDVDIVKATGIPWATWHGWITGDVRAQLADQNLLKLQKFFNVHLEYLVYGIGNGEEIYNEKRENEDKDLSSDK